MTYKATAVKVMIACPSDVERHKRQVRAAISDWNATHSEQTQIVLMPVSWDSHATPSLADRPQEVINQQISGYDILVAVLWTRIGTPTGVATSGTVEEIQIARKEGRPTLLYFCEEPAALRDVDLDQHNAVQEFRKSLSGQGLYWSFSTITEFTSLIERHLTRTVYQDFTHLSEPAPLENTQRSSIDGLSRDEQLLLVAGAFGDGTIVQVTTMAGTRVEANDQSFATIGDMRSEARWRAVVKELAQRGLIEDRGGRGELYFVTDSGFKAAELLKEESEQ